MTICNLEGIKHGSYFFWRTKVYPSFQDFCAASLAMSGFGIWLGAGGGRGELERCSLSDKFESEAGGVAGMDKGDLVRMEEEEREAGVKDG